MTYIKVGIMGQIKLYTLNNRSSYLLDNIKTMEQSKSMVLNKDDIKKVAINALTFLAPALLIFLTAIKSGVPVKDALYAVYLWLINVLIDLLKKFIAS
jgi:hypothetical protein